MKNNNTRESNKLFIEKMKTIFPRFYEAGIFESTLAPFLKKGGGIHIKKKNKGKFTKSAHAAGKSVQEHAYKVINNPNSSETQRKRAQFAINAKKWHH